MTVVFMKRNLFQINNYFITYTLVSKLRANHQSNTCNLDAYIWGWYTYHVLTNKSMLRFAYLFVEKIVDTIYIYIHVVIEGVFHAILFCCKLQRN